MRIAALALALACLLWAAAPASAAPTHSANVSLVGVLPEAVGAASAHFSPDGHLMYVSTWKGLHVYDVTDPRNPQRVGFLPLPHFENEDVDAGPGVVVITNDPQDGVGLIYVIDVSNPRLPRIRSVIRNGDYTGVTNSLINDGTTSNTGHIANCFDGCRWLWTTGSDEGFVIWDLHDLDHPRFVRKQQVPLQGYTHDVWVDPTGIAWVTGQDGTFGYDARDPSAPKLVYRSDEHIKNSGNGWPNSPQTAENYPLDLIHHNAMRLDENLGDDGTVSRTAMGTGNVLAITEEDAGRPTCEGQGSSQTWRISPTATNSDGTRKLELLDMWTTELNGLETQTGRSPATILCSAHWFDYDKGLVAQAWYDQGVRFLDESDPRHIRQVGYYIQGTFWSAYFAPTDPTRQTVYALDVTGGIDILHIDRGIRAGKMRTVRAPILKRWLSGPRTRAQPSARFGYACPLLGSLFATR